MGNLILSRSRLQVTFHVEEFGVYRSICVMIRRSCPYLSVGAPDCADGMSVDVMSSHGSQAAKKNKVA